MAYHKLSQLFQPKIIIPPGKETKSEILSLSQKLLFNLGLVRSNNAGTNILLPLAVRAMDKLKRLINKDLKLMGAQEIFLPVLTPEDLFEKTGRAGLSELFKLTDKHGKKFILSPTHEEAVVNLMSSIKPSYKSLPVFLFQVTSKFRDEIKPRFGLMRSREFLMKDMYCFETSEKSSLASYNKMNDCYRRIFQRLGLPYCLVKGNTGEIGGSLSHEFHVLSNTGEDKVTVCLDCDHAQLVSGSNMASTCFNCKSSNVKHQNAIEVGHSFLLGTRYTKPLNAVFTAPDNSLQYLEMSCHGIGLSRLLAAGVEALSTNQEIRWPCTVAPFSVCLIPPKAGSKEENHVTSNNICAQLSSVIGDDLVVDDRLELTIGKRLTEAKQMGYPFIFVVGKKSLETPSYVEIHDTYSGGFELVQLPNATSFLKQRLANWELRK